MCFFEWLIFADESTFHINWKVSKHNVRIEGHELPRAVVQHDRSPKLNGFLTISDTKVNIPFIFQENTVKGAAYWDMSSEWLMSQLMKTVTASFGFQKGAATHWLTHVKDYLDENLPQSWIGCSADEHISLFGWPPQTPTLT